MTIRHIVSLVLLTLLLATAPAAAQNAAPRIAIANPGRILSELQETRDLEQKMEAEVRNLQAQLQERNTKLEELRQARGAFKPGTEQHEAKNKELLQASADLEVWTRVMQAEQQRQRKQRMKLLFDKITTAIGEVAQQKEIDLVIADIRPDVPEEMDDPRYTFDMLKAALNQRNILYHSARVDISSEVIAAMDARYKTGQ
jgi:Skp family chaperone for outer membrane proteins